MFCSIAAKEYPSIELEFPREWRSAIMTLDHCIVPDASTLE